MIVHQCLDAHLCGFGAFLVAVVTTKHCGNGGLEWAAGRSDSMAEILYGWAEASEFATPYVTDPAVRSSIVGTIDLDDRVDADDVVEACAANGILDIGGYRKLGRNQLRISMFPGVDPADIQALTGCLDYVVGELAE